MTYKPFFSIGFTALLFFSFQAPSYAGVYKWVDEAGQIHYSDQPNKPDAEEFTLRKNITTRSRPLNSGDQAIKDSAETDTDIASKKPVEPKLVEIEISKKEKNRLCNQAKSDYAAISSRGRMRELNAQGEYIYLSEQQRQQRLSATKKIQHEYCR